MVDYMSLNNPEYRAESLEELSTDILSYIDGDYYVTIRHAGAPFLWHPGFKLSPDQLEKLRQWLRGLSTKETNFFYDVFKSYISVVLIMFLIGIALYMLPADYRNVIAAAGEYFFPVVAGAFPLYVLQEGKSQRRRVFRFISNELSVVPINHPPPKEGMIVLIATRISERAAMIQTFIGCAVFGGVAFVTYFLGTKILNDYPALNYTILLWSFIAGASLISLPFLVAFTAWSREMWLRHRRFRIAHGCSLQKTGPYPIDPQTGDILPPQINNDVSDT